MPQYDIFLPANSRDITYKYPLTITLLQTDGTISTHEVTNPTDHARLPDYAAFKVHKPVDPLQQMIEDLWRTCSVSRYQARMVLNYLNDKGFLKVDGQPSDWLDQKMDQLGIHYDTTRRNIRNWFENPEKHPEVNYDLKNQILTVKPSGSGRVVVLPTGHTIAYTTAKEIYFEMQGERPTNPYYPYDYNGNYVKVGEYVNRSITYRKYRCTINSKGVTIGCQTVPRQAIEDFAKREGW